MQNSAQQIEALLASAAPFQGLPAGCLAQIAQNSRIQGIQLGSTVLAAGERPDAVWLVLEGSLRSLGSAENAQASPRTLEKLGPGTLAGWLSLSYNYPLEHLRASTNLHALVIPAELFTELIAEESAFKEWSRSQLPAAELFSLIKSLISSGTLHGNPHELLADTLEFARTWSNGKDSDSTQISPDEFIWYELDPPNPPTPQYPLQDPPASAQRIIGWPQDRGFTPQPILATPQGEAIQLVKLEDSSFPLSPQTTTQLAEQAPHLELKRAAGNREIPLAICLAIAAYYRVPANRDDLNEQIISYLQRQSFLNLTNYGQLLSNLGLRVMLCEVPYKQLKRVPTPAIIEASDKIGILDGVDQNKASEVARILEPELGPVRIPVQELTVGDTGNIRLLTIERSPESKTSRFSWAWYGPYLKPYRRDLIEVLATSAVVNTLALVTPLGLQVLIDQVSRNPSAGGALISISALLLVASLVAAIVRSVRSLIFTNLANRIDQATKSTILDQLVRLPQSFFDSRPVGQVTFYFTQLDKLREFLVSQSLTTIVDFGFSLIYIAVLVALNPLLTLVTLSTLPLFIVLGLLSNPIVDRLLERSIGQAIKTYSYLNEAITGIQTIKSQNAELKTRWEFQNRYSKYIGEDFKLRITGETISSLATFINDLNGLLVIGFGISLVMQDKLTLGGFIAFRIISGYVTGPLVRLVSTWQQFKQASQSLQIVGDVVDRTTEQTEEEAQNIPMPPLIGEVSVRDVAFRFSEDGPRILHHVSLEIPAGSFVGMVGGSGSGKSTLLKLLPRFYRPESGSVLIDGYDINKVELYSLRRQIGVVPQDSLLFDGTIKDNLLLVKPDATTEELVRAARIACAHDFIMNLPQGYNSSVGERGAGLSGGQRQRMALARAVLQNPRMLILDEATSALDARTERQVCLNLFEAFRGRTVFFITHRLSTVRPADMIVLMDRGAIMEVGNHKQLMDKQGWYYALYQSQNQEGVS